MRVKRGQTSHQKHNKIRKLTKGMTHPNRVSIKRGKQTIVKSLQFATRDRKIRKRTFRQLWNIRINNAARENGMTYSQFINQLKKHNIDLNRKILAEIAIKEPQAFSSIVSKIKS